MNGEGDLHEAGELLQRGVDPLGTEPGDLHEADELLHTEPGDLHEAATVLREEAATAPPPLTVDGRVNGGDGPRADARDSGPFSEPASRRSREHEVIHLEEAAEVLPTLARVAAGAWLRAAAWSLGTGVRISARLARAAADPDAAAALAEDLTVGLRGYARAFLGIDDLDERLRELTPLTGVPDLRAGVDPEEVLRERGEQLLQQAADVSYVEGAHPAYARILGELAPDEARILRLLAVDGPQPAVDVRAANLIGIGSQLVAPNLTMLGAQAGLRRRDRVPAYINNLQRLGLATYSDDMLTDTVAYQVLEAQPEVLDLIRDTPRAKAIHRSVRLTPFGRDFCETCLPLGPSALPAGEAPPDPDDASLV